MMIQPFVENSIWHGLLKKNGEKYINITFTVLDKYVRCVMEDNGTGRKPDPQAHLKKSSHATGFIEQRLNLLNRIHHLECKLVITDKPDNGGTIVDILLPLLNSSNATTSDNN
jgi:LytS/YehU family sensor histidine kinase